MPGRLKLGFTYSYDAQNSLHMLLGGEFRPVVWPSYTQKHISYSVMVQGEAWTFTRAYTISSFGTSTGSLTPSAVLAKYGVDDGKTEAQACIAAWPVNGGTGYELDAAPDLQVYQSMDGRRYLFMSRWRCHQVGKAATSTDGIVPVGQRMALVNGQESIWTNCQGLTHFQTIWGDHLTVTETDLTSNQFPPKNMGGLYNGGSIVIADANNPGRSIILNVSDGVLDVTNTLGLPEAKMGGKIYLKQREDSDYASATTPPMPLPVFDFGFVPTTLTETASNGESRATSFEWYLVNSIYLEGCHYPNALKSMTFPNGLKESFTYSQRGYAHLSEFAFSPENGGWSGFNPNPNYAVWALPVPAVDQISSVKGSDGTCVKIQRVAPTWYVNADPNGWPWITKDHTTTIQTYATSDGSGPCRTVKLTHPSFAGLDGNNVWGGPNASQSEVLAAYLFATSSVLKAEFFDSSNNLYRTVSYSGWAFHSYFNTAGTVFFSVGATTQGGPSQTVSMPLTPEPTLVTVSEPGLPTRTKQLSSWDRWSYAQRLLDGKAGSEDAGTQSVVVRGQGDSLDVLTYGDTHTLNGASIPDLRGGVQPGFQVSQVGNQYDAMDRLTQTTSVNGKAWIKKVMTYTGLNPQPVDTTVTGANDGGTVVMLPGGGSTTVPPQEFLLSGKVGTVCDYYGGPAFLLKSETDKLTKRTTSYDYDDLDRVHSVTDPDGVTTITGYDAWGRVASTTRQAVDGVDAVTTLYAFDPAGLWSTETVKADGRTLTTKTTYDAWGRVVSVVKPDSSHQESVYDGWGELLSQTPWIRPGQATYGSTQWTYDAKGRVTKQVDPKGRTVMTAPTDPTWDDAQGGVTTTVYDDRGYASTVVKDLLGQQRMLIDKAGHSASFAYDGFGHLVQVKFGAQVRSFTYNELGWLMTRSDPEEGTTTFSGFTINGTPTMTDRTGRGGNGMLSLSTQLDDMGRPFQVMNVLGFSYLQPYRTFHYDPVHATRLIGVDEYQPNGTLQEAYGFDGLGRMTSKRITDETGQSFIVSRTLDALGNPLSLTYPAGGNHPARTLLFNYDAYLRPTDATLGLLRGHMDYDQVAGTAVTDTLTYGNGAKTASVTDRGELARVTHFLGGSAVEDNALSWTAGGLLLNRGADAFSYDRLGRLSSAVIHGVQGETLTQGFGYDMYGNRTQSSVSLSGGTSPEALSWTATYDATNSLPKQVVAPSGPLDTGAQYDGFGNLLQVFAVPGQSGTQASWIYDPEGRVVQENGTKFLLDASGLRFRRVHPDGTFEYVVYGFNRDPLSTFGSVAQPAPSLKPAPQAKRPQGLAPHRHSH